MVRLENVVKKYNDSLVVGGVNLEIRQGQFAVFIGPSGCGKTTTLKMINRLIEPTSGRIYIAGEDIAGVDPVLLRRKIGYVIQQIGLFPNMTIAQNIALVPKLLGWDAERRRKRTEELLRMVDMEPEQYMGRYPNELSGGQQQRVGVLRALAVEPPLVLMDEPFGALDPITRDTLQDEVKKLQKRLNKTILFVTHDMDEAIKLADVIILMKDGKILQAASPEELLSKPANDFVAEFIGKHRLNNDTELQSVSDVMKINPVTVTKEKGVEESIALMKSRGVSTVIVVDNAGRYEGIVSIEEIRNKGKGMRDLAAFMHTGTAVVNTGAEAKEAFDLIVNHKLDFAIAVDDDSIVRGIVTKTSMVKALAQIVWKDNGND